MTLTAAAADDGKIFAPWSADQVRALQIWQTRGQFHPYTCPLGCGELVPSLGGWFCGCGYRQLWAWDPERFE